MWNDAAEIAATVGEIDEDVSEGEIRDAIALHRRVRETLGDNE